MSRQTLKPLVKVKLKKAEHGANHSKLLMWILTKLLVRKPVLLMLAIMKCKVLLEPIIMKVGNTLGNVASKIAVKPY